MTEDTAVCDDESWPTLLVDVASELLDGEEEAEEGADDDDEENDSLDMAVELVALE